MAPADLNTRADRRGISCNMNLWLTGVAGVAGVRRWATGDPACHPGILSHLMNEIPRIQIPCCIPGA